MTSEKELSTAISKIDNPDQDFEEFLGSIQFLEDRVYIQIENGVCLGFDRYVLDELLKREKVL
ncbi:MAG: hypothetical protein M0Q91_05445 [Methanoregula sp.]|jgi:uncharacterized Fe-S cluster-containing radical SAM superfamily protein|nr:hypothetical protein [Methanoregula sp.]